jgi:hypothetical protein
MFIESVGETHKSCTSEFEGVCWRSEWFILTREVMLMDETYMKEV